MEAGAVSGAAGGAVAAEPREGSRPVIRRAGRLLLVAGALGLVGQLLFFDVGLGLNFPVAIGILLTGGWALRYVSRPQLVDLWLTPASLLFAAFAAIRADPVIVTLDVLTALGLAGGALASFGGRSVVARSFGALLELGLGALGWATTGAVAALADARRSMPTAASVTRRASPAMPILRGLAIALPIVLVFVALFSSADAVFARIVEDLFGIELQLGDAGWRMLLVLVLAWLAAGSLALAASGPPADRTDSRRAMWRPGTTEVVTVLVAVDAVFLLFVALQGAYLFGGLDTLSAGGMTYADYARRGFFELVAVAALAGGLVVGAERLARERSRALLVTTTGLALLTGVVLVSATLRLRLYQEAYGWTELRLYVLATIGVLAIGVIGLVVALVTNRVRCIGHLVLVAGLAVGLVLNVIGPVRFITEQNVARVLDPELVPDAGKSGLDVGYAISLGDDSVPALVRVLPALAPDDAHVLGGELILRLDQLEHDQGLNAWQAWNAGRAAARDALQGAGTRGVLP